MESQFLLENQYRAEYLGQLGVVKRNM